MKIRDGHAEILVTFRPAFWDLVGMLAAAYRHCGEHDHPLPDLSKRKAEETIRLRLLAKGLSAASAETEGYVNRVEAWAEDTIRRHWGEEFGG
jgi:hypothetical protein